MFFVLRYRIVVLAFGVCFIFFVYVSLFKFGDFVNIQVRYIVIFFSGRMIGIFVEMLFVDYIR